MTNTVDVVVVQAPEFLVWDVIAPPIASYVLNPGTYQPPGNIMIPTRSAFAGARVICRGPRGGLNAFRSIFENGEPITFRTTGETFPFYETTERVRGFFMTDLPGDQIEIALLLA